MEELLLNQLGIEIVKYTDNYLGYMQYNKLFLFKSYYDANVFSNILRDIKITSDFGTKKNVFNNITINGKIYTNAIIMTELNMEQLKPNFMKNVYIKFFLIVKNNFNLFVNIIEADNIYKYNFFSTEKVCKINKLTLNNPIARQKIYGTYVWVVPLSENIIHDNELWKSLIFRYPVYFGIPKYNMFNMNKAKKYFPYLNDLELINNVPRNNVYTIGSLIDCYAYGSNEIGTIGMLHTWGVNFESDKTPDYKEMLLNDQWNKNGFNNYVNRVRQLLKTIFTASDSLVNKANMLDRRIVVRIPALGLGNFLNGIIIDNIKNECKLIFMSELLFAARIWKNNSDNKIIKFCQYDTKDNYLLMGDQTDVEYQPDLLKVELSDISDNVLTIIVNAWDSHSFIGNGGSRDNSIDGKIGAGINGSIECAAYSQNPFFIPYEVLKKSMIAIK